MAQYIDKSALLVEIDRQKIGSNVDGKHSVEYNTTKKILDIIDTLPVKEVETSSDKKQLKLKEDCHTCTYNLYGLYPCAAVNKQGAIDYLEGKTDGCSEWYDEW